MAPPKRRMETLEDLMTFAIDSVQADEADPDDALSVLHMLGCTRDKDDEVTEPTFVTAVLAVAGAPEYGVGQIMSTTCRLMILQYMPHAAVLVQPAHAAMLPANESLKTYGVTHVRDLPPDFVYDTLMFHGEDEQGGRIVRGFVLRRDKDMKRVWQDIEKDSSRIEMHNVDAPRSAEYHSIFDPMFVLPEMLKVSGGVAKTVFNLDEERTFYHARKAAMRFFAGQLLKMTPDE